MTAAIRRFYRNHINTKLGRGFMRLVLASFLVFYTAYFFGYVEVPLFSRDDPAVRAIRFSSEPVAVGDVKVEADGRETSLSALPGRFRIAFLWASWCGVCKMKMPYIKERLKEFRANGLNAAFVATGDSDPRVLAGVERELSPYVADGTLVSVRDASGTLFRRLGLQSVPAFALLDKDARVVGYIDLNLHAPDLVRRLGKLAALNNAP
jgi:thiol-disulfide isomerase/thioredoxin